MFSSTLNGQQFRNSSAVWCPCFIALKMHPMCQKEICSLLINQNSSQ